MMNNNSKQQVFKLKPNHEKPKKASQAPSAYILFCKEKRREIQAAYPTASFTEIGKLMGATWNNMGELDRAPYVQLAAEAKVASEHGLATTKPKKSQAPSAYIMFCVHKRPEIQAANPTATFGDLGRTLGLIWKSMSDADKEPYIGMAKEAKIHHDQGQMAITRPKKPQAPSAYITFCVLKRPEVIAANPTATFGELGRMLGAIWNSMSDIDKAPYMQMAAEAKANQEAALTNANNNQW